MFVWRCSGGGRCGFFLHDSQSVRSSALENSAIAPPIAAAVSVDLADRTTYGGEGLRLRLSRCDLRFQFVEALQGDDPAALRHESAG